MLPSPLPRLSLLATLVLAGCATARGEIATGATPQGTVSAPIHDVRYVIEFDSAHAVRRTVRVEMSFTTSGDAPVLLSLPAWTPGAYELSYFARWVTAFTAEGDGSPLSWQKADHDTWRVYPAGARRLTVRVDYRADTLDTAMSWTQPDFGMFNGTNIFLYPEGRSPDYPSVVTVRTHPGWKVATGMRRAPGEDPRTFREGNYHDLVDMPLFIGLFDLDSMTIAGRVTRLASYPEGAVAGEMRRRFWRHQEQMIPPLIAVFGDAPYDSYSTLLVITPEIGGGAALEHQNSHVGIYNPGLLPLVSFPSITAHEIAHLWNVKRLRPAELWPYRYDRLQPTTLLWVSEGITDYYADLALVRGGVVDSTIFFVLTRGKLQRVTGSPPVALEDASLSAWINPVVEPDIYYDKGSLAGLMLDILIRDASDNRGSLDQVMRDLYESTYRRGRGFTDAEFWAAATRAAGGRSFAEEHRRYVAGRERFPWSTVLPLAGLRLVTDTLQVPSLGMQTQADGEGVRVWGVAMGSAAEQAGVEPGDLLLRVGEIEVRPDVDFGPAFRARYSGRGGDRLPLTVRRRDRTLTLNATVQLQQQVQQQLIADPRAGEKAVRVRTGILHGR